MADRKDQTRTKALTTAHAGGIEVYQNSAQLPAAIRTQWEYGDWRSLQTLSLDAIEHEEARALVAAIVAVAHHQEEAEQQAKPYLQKAVEWGMDKRAIAQVFAAGTYNSLGRAALLSESTPSALAHFQKAIETGVPGADAKLLAPVRAGHQAAQMGIQVSIPYQPDQEDPKRLEDNSKPYTVQLMAILGSFAQRLVQHGQALVVDGVEVFKEKDPFLPGKIAMGMAYWVTEHSSGSAITQQRCQQFRKVMKEVGDQRIESWGIHFYLKALQMLNEADLLTECFRFQELVGLKKRLDWRAFVDEADYTLIKKPNNFYGIAYSIAYTRYQLGWDDLKHSQNLLEKELDHYEDVSGGEGFADETNGKGRFDRYSFLLIAEIAYRFYEAGLPLTQRMKKWLKASADYVLFNVNERGDGFQWGRSIGAYGDSAFLEILTAAKVHNLLDEQEEAVACYFAQRITRKFLTFWYQNDRESINLWSDGRATDSYRGKHRILGENVSLLHQHLYCQRHWDDCAVCKDQDCLKELVDQWVKRQPTLKISWLTTQESEFVVITKRYKNRLVNLPLVNGDCYWKEAAYQPIPFISGIVEAIPEFAEPVFVPKIQIPNQGVYLVHPSYKNIELVTEDGVDKVLAKFAGLSSIENKTPVKDVDVHGTLVLELSDEEVRFGAEIDFPDSLSDSTVSSTFCVAGSVAETERSSFIFALHDQGNVALEIMPDRARSLEITQKEETVNTVQSRAECLYVVSTECGRPENLNFSWALRFD